MAPKKTLDGETKMTAVRLPVVLLKRIDRYAKKAGKMSGSEALRSLIEAGLDVKEKGPPAPEWVATLEDLATRLNTDAAGAVEVLKEYVEQPDAPEPAKKGRGTKLFGLI